MVADFDIQGTIVGLGSAVKSKINYRVEAGLADFVFEFLKPYMQAAAKLSGNPILEVLSPFALAAIKEVLPDWRAPSREGFNDNSPLAGKNGPSNHFNIPPYYLHSDAASTNYLFANYLGENKDRRNRPAGAQSRAASEFLDRDVVQFAPPPVLNEDFQDGGFEQAGQTFRDVQSIASAADIDPFVLAWSDLQLRTPLALGGAWSVQGDVRLGASEGNSYAELRDAGESSISQLVNLSASAQEIAFRTVIVAPGGDAELRLLVNGETFATRLVSTLPADSTIQVSLPSHLRGLAKIEVQVHGSDADIAVLRIDDLRIVRPLDGDVNGDRSVDFRDFGILRANFGIQNALRSQGDLNGDQRVNLLDFAILRQNFGRRGEFEEVPSLRDPSLQGSAPALKSATASLKGKGSPADGSALTTAQHQRVGALGSAVTSRELLPKPLGKANRWSW